jgi:polyisoprenyl-teichoic acid--peptidoglycan teichoic acid transferase
MTKKTGKVPLGAYNRSSRCSERSSPPSAPTQGDPKERSPFYLGFFWGLAVTLTAAISAIIGAAIALVNPASNYFAQSLQQGQLPWMRASATQEREETGEALPPSNLSRPINLLVMGIDRVSGAAPNSPEAFTGYSDALMLVRVDPNADTLKILSIPRGSRVETADTDFTTVKEANVRGGPALVSRVVSRMLNDVPIDRYIRVTPDAFRELVNLVGGVEVNVPYSMSYQDMTQNFKIDLQAGWQTLDGEQAEEFVRFKRDRDGDLGRMQRQQVVLKALQKQLYSPAIVPKIPQITRLLRQYVDTNLSLEEMLALASFGRDLDRQSTEMVMLPGRLNQSGNSWLVSQSDRDRLVDEYFNRAAQTPLKLSTPQDLKIVVQNATNNSELTERVVEYLSKKDFRNVRVSTEASDLIPKTEIIAQTGHKEAARTLKTILGVGRVEASSTGDLNSDLTIRIGADVKQLLGGESFLTKSSADKNNDN